MTNLVGQTLGQYRIIEQIGQGGMATVYKGYQPSLDRYVAVKVLPSYFAHEPGFAMRFTREAKAVARLNHPNILPIHDFGQEGDLGYIVMKYVEVGTLKDIVGTPLALGLTADIIGQIAAALDHAHQRGILHRDVKPSNVLLDEGRWALLTDFGLAKMVEGSVALTGSGVGVGTPAYMAPEQGRGESVDARADIYSLGVVLYEMLTGRVPFEAETPMAVVIRHITDPLPLPRSINPALPEAVERVILKALAKDPADRFASTTEMAEALTAAVSAAPESVPETIEVSVAQPPPKAERVVVAASAATVAQAPARLRGIPWKAVGALAGVVLLAVLAVLIATNLGGDGRGRETPTAVVVATATAAKEAVAVARSSPTDTPPPPTPTDIPPPPAPTDTPLPTPTHTLLPTPTHTRIPTPTPRPPTPTHTLRPPTNTPIPTSTATPLPPLPGRETIPLDELAPSIPWLPLDPNAIPMIQFFGFNLAAPPFDNPLVRQAFALAVDRQALANLANDWGLVQARPATTIIPPETLGRDLYPVVGLPFDPDRARDLLAQAGYPNGEGFPPVTLASNHTDWYETLANAVSGMWRDVLGVQVELEWVDWSIYSDYLSADAPPLLRVRWGADINDPDNFFSIFVTDGRLGGMHFSNAEFDSLMVQAATAANDPATRQRLYVQAERILCEQEVVVIPLIWCTIR